jgi:hypothetical protein
VRTVPEAVPRVQDAVSQRFRGVQEGRKNPEIILVIGESGCEEDAKFRFQNAPGLRYYIFLDVCDTGFCSPGAMQSAAKNLHMWIIRGCVNSLQSLDFLKGRITYVYDDYVGNLLM